jgi:hypothetical protein
MNETTESNFLDERSDFSLVLGGPTFQFLRKTRLEGEHLELLWRRIVVITSFVWVPMCFLAYFASSANSESRLSFLHDVEVHARFLIAVPVLIAGELLVHLRIRPVVRRFVERHIVTSEDRPRFECAVQSAIKLRNSIPAEIAVLLFVYVLGLLLWNHRFGITTSTWYASPGGRWNLTPAGYWYVFVSLPIAQFLLVRWYFRLFIWFRFLWQVSRLRLHLIPSHPDRCAGLSFLGKSSYAFGPVLFAQGAMLAGLLASRILYRGESLLSFKLQIGGFVAFFVTAVLGPLVMFTPKLAESRRKGLRDYGQLAQRYVEDFEKKWVTRNSPGGEELLGSADIQSLADLGNSYGMVREMRPVPFGLDDITRLAAACAAPLVPLLLTIFSPEELLLRIVKVIF